MFHGQLNQDKWVFEQLIKRGYSLGKHGFYVDVGAFDGKHFSNSLVFEQLGWRGICVEAHADSYEKCKANRPNATCVNAIVTAEDGGSELFVRNDVEPMLSHVTRTHVQGLSNPTKSLTTILKECNAPSQIDYLSIDVEGVDFEVLKGFDLMQYQATCITIEHNGQEQASEIANWLWANNYLVLMVEFDFFAVKDTVRVR